METIKSIAKYLINFEQNIPIPEKVFYTLLILLFLTLIKMSLSSLLMDWKFKNDGS